MGLLTARDDDPGARERAFGRGPRTEGRRRSPYDGVRGSLQVAGLFVLGGVVWVVAADGLPGGRWAGVHLFTLGVLTPLVLGFTSHFAGTLTRSAQDLRAWPVPTAIGVVLVVIGLPNGFEWAVGAGSTLLTGVVVVSYLAIRQARRASIGARFEWILRMYEWAHGFFGLGALLGVAMGVGLVPGEWYAAIRLTHLHVMVLGWGGLTLLATVVFFGPTLARARIADAAEARSAGALRRGAVGLAVASIALALTAAGEAVVLPARLLAAGGLAVLAWAAVVVCWDVGRVAARTRRGSTWALVVGVAVWFPVVAWADVAVVAIGRWGWLPPLGAAVGVGVLGQAMLATVMQVVPLLRPKEVRLDLTHRLEHGAVVRAVLWNLAALLLVIASARILLPGGVAVAGGILAIVAGQLVWTVSRPTG